MAPTLSEIADAFNLGLGRLEMWQSRGHVIPSSPGKRGTSRQWAGPEAFRLVVMAQLVDGGISGRTAAEIATRTLIPFVGEDSFLVVWTGSTFSSDSGFENVLPRDRWIDDQVGRDELVEAVSRDGVRVAVVVPLAPIVATLREMIGEAD